MKIWEKNVLDRGPASAKDWTWEIAWAVQGTARWPEWQKQNGQVGLAFGEIDRVL